MISSTCEQNPGVLPRRSTWRPWRVLGPMILQAEDRPPLGKLPRGLLQKGRLESWRPHLRPGRGLTWQISCYGGGDLNRPTWCKCMIQLDGFLRINLLGLQAKHRLGGVDGPSLPLLCP